VTSFRLFSIYTVSMNEGRALSSTDFMQVRSEFAPLPMREGNFPWWDWLLRVSDPRVGNGDDRVARRLS
jgi:hypothetical protein